MFDGLIYKITFSAEWQINLCTIAFILIGIIAAYLLGSINTAIVVSKIFYRDDIRKYGSGNAGLTNMLRTFGKGAAGLTLLGDLLKTVLAILITAFLFGIHYNGGVNIDNGYCYVAGLFAVVGHVFPIYYGFKGGKGVLVTATMALILTPPIFAIMLALFILVVAISKYVSLGSVIGAVLYPVLLNGYINFVLDNKLPGLIAFCSIFLAIFIVWCHRENLARISNKTERKLSFKKKSKEPAQSEEDKDK